jgi:hypothetical protein
LLIQQSAALMKSKADGVPAPVHGFVQRTLPLGNAAEYPKQTRRFQEDWQSQLKIVTHRNHHRGKKSSGSCVNVFKQDDSQPVSFS